MRMRIVLDVRPALSRPTGVGVYVGALAEALPRRDGESRYTLFTSSLRERWSHPPQGSNVEISDHRIPVRVLNFAWNRLYWPRIETICGREFDIIHSPHALLVPSARGRRIITIHDLYFYKHPEMTSGEVRRDYAPLVKHHARRADGIICPSEHTARDVARLLNVPSERVCVTPYGLDSAYRQRPAEDAVRSLLDRLRLPPRFILYVGNDEKRKNIAGLVTAYRAFAAGRQGALPLVLVGQHADYSSGDSERARIVSTGYLPTDEVRIVMGAAACLVLVSLEEGFGFTVLEAMAAGVPVVCSRGSSLSEIAGSAAEFVDPLDTRAIGEALDRVLSNPERARELQALGFEQSLRFDWDRTAELTLAFYRRVLAA
jgi:glycosyltransferase involved in cell wall biosynthesis